MNSIIMDIKKIREEKRITIEEVSAALNVSSSTVWRMEKEPEKISIIEFMKLADLYGIDNIFKKVAINNTPLELIMALFEEIKQEKKDKAGNQRNRNRLSQIKGLVTDAKRQLIEEDKSL